MNKVEEKIMAEEKKVETPKVEATKVETPKDDLANFSIEAFERKKAKKLEDETWKRAMKLERVIITCNNKNKTSYQGEIFCAKNAFIPEVKKFVPFGVPTHVPHILMSMIREKQYQTFFKKKVNGVTQTESKLIPEYNIQELPPITSEELNAIRQKQLAEGNQD